MFARITDEVAVPPSTSVKVACACAGDSCDIAPNSPATGALTCLGADGGCTNMVEGDGDCDADADCSGDLVCGSNNCIAGDDPGGPHISGTHNWDGGDDCCMPRPGGPATNPPSRQQRSDPTKSGRPKRRMVRQLRLEMDQHRILWWNESRGPA